MKLRQDIDFFQYYSSTKQSRALNAMTLVVTALILLSVLVVGGVYTLLQTRIVPLKQDIASVSSYLQQPQNLEKAARSNQDQARLSLLGQYQQGVVCAAQKFTQLPKINASVIRNIDGLKPGDVAIRSFSFSGNVLTLQCTAVGSLSAPVFVKNLEQVSAFSLISYGGQNSFAAADGKPVYSFSVACTLKGGDGK